MQTSRRVIAIPTLNEAAHIGPLLTDLLASQRTCPIWVLDGGSSDGTRQIVARLAAHHPTLRLIDNPQRLQAAAINRAARMARALGADILVRLDAHARYPQGFVDGICGSLQMTGADSVVVPLIAEASHGWPAAAAALQRSWIGHGGAAHRRTGTRGWVAHGHHAAFRLDRFLALGGYAEHFAANEDAEFDLRLTAAGGRIYLQDRWPVRYRPRATPLALWRQMHRNGRWRVETARAHARPLALRQRAPVAAVTLCAASLFAGAQLHVSAAAPAALYLLAILVAACVAGPPRMAARIGLLALVSHAGFATGVLRNWLTPPRPQAPHRARHDPHRTDLASHA